MPHDDVNLIRRHPTWLATLQAYWNAHLERKKQANESDGWVARLSDVADVPPESLSGIHGRLIAFGYLKFELTAKDASLRYQLTPLGRTIVTGEISADAAEPEWA